MIVYLDSSVILRKFFSQKGALPHWNTWEKAFTSEIAVVESYRSIDCNRLTKNLEDSEVAELIGLVRKLSDYVHFMDINAPVLKRAADSYPTVIRALDAVHLASACLLRDQLNRDLAFLTHDKQQGIAARAVGFDVIGVS